MGNIAPLTTGRKKGPIPPVRHAVAFVNSHQGKFRAFGEFVRTSAGELIRQAGGDSLELLASWAREMGQFLMGLDHVALEGLKVVGFFGGSTDSRRANGSSVKSGS